MPSHSLPGSAGRDAGHGTLCLYPDGPRDTKGSLQWLMVTPPIVPGPGDGFKPPAPASRSPIIPTQPCEEQPVPQSPRGCRAPSLSSLHFQWARGRTQGLGPGSRKPPKRGGAGGAQLFPRTETSYDLAKPFGKVWYSLSRVYTYGSLIPSNLLGWLRLGLNGRVSCPSKPLPLIPLSNRQ